MRALLSKFNKFILLLALLLVGCERPDPSVTIVGEQAPVTPFVVQGVQTSTAVPPGQAVPTAILPTRAFYNGQPTPDPPRSNGDAGFITHAVGPGESLGYIATLYGSSLEEIQAVNQIVNPELLYVGQEILIPRDSALVGPSFKIIPDSELVYGPAARGFDVRSFVSAYGGYLLRYSEQVEGVQLDGPDVVNLVAHRYSVNPRLLLAVLEHRAGWVTQPNAVDSGYPLAYVQPNLTGLYQQLGWAANELNLGYYGRSEGGQTSVLLRDGTRVAFADTINDGTAAVQRWLSAHDSATYSGWQQESGPDGLFATYSRLFGNPFAFTVEPLWSPEIQQPPLALPWLPGETWYYTGGPHGGWASGSAWAALDFVPGGEQLGCFQSQDFVRAMAVGVVSRSNFGAVVVDLDGDGYAGTGWAILYMHIATQDRLSVGTRVEVGDPIGHPSCEGGFSNGTHVHIARTYNGRWIAADGVQPFVMGNFVSEGLGREYDGILVSGNEIKEACECRDEINAIRAE